MSFEAALAFVLEIEGGATVTDDPKDPGGLTKYGISKRSHPGLDIANLTEAEASAIYRAEYWDKCRCGELPNAIACVVFDSAVNQGVGMAARILQEALGLKEDGIIGSGTLQAATEAGDGLLAELVARRMLAYGSVPQFTRFGLGWSRRLSKVHELAMRAS